MHHTRTKESKKRRNEEREETLYDDAPRRRYCLSGSDGPPDLQRWRRCFHASTGPHIHRSTGIIACFGGLILRYNNIFLTFVFPMQALTSSVRAQPGVARISPAQFARRVTVPRVCSWFVCVYIVQCGVLVWAVVMVWWCWWCWR